jgi:hypothetical protein
LWKFTQKQNTALAALGSGQWAEAETRGRDGLAAAGELVRERGQAICAAGLVVCRALHAQRRYVEAEEEARRTLQLAGPVPSPAERAGWGLLHLLIGELLVERGRLEDAEAEAREAELLRPEGNDRYEAAYLGLRAAIARSRGELRQALGWAGELQTRLQADAGDAVLLRSALYGEALHPERGLDAAREEAEARSDDPDRRAAALHVLGCLLTKLNRMAEAETAHREELELLSRSRQAGDIRLAGAWIHLAVALAKAGQAEGAAAALREVRQWNGELRSQEQSAWLYGLGMTRAMEGRLEESAMALRECVALDEKRTRVGHPVTVDGLWALAQVTEALGNSEGAESLRLRVEEIRREYAGIA